MSANGHQMTAAAPATATTATPSAFDAHASNGHANGNGLSNGNGLTNGNGNGHHSFENEKALPHQAPMYNGGAGGGNYLSRTLTPGGHYADDDLIAIANGHRRIGNPLPLGGKFQSPI